MSLQLKSGAYLDSWCRSVKSCQLRTWQMALPRVPQAWQMHWVVLLLAALF